VKQTNAVVPEHITARYRGLPSSGGIRGGAQSLPPRRFARLSRLIDVLGWAAWFLVAPLAAVLVLLALSLVVDVWVPR
jgi:hypothetical protein